VYVVVVEQMSRGQDVCCDNAPEKEEREELESKWGRVRIGLDCWCLRQEPLTVRLFVTVAEL
jgi:hypothetical protein